MSQLATISGRFLDDFLRALSRARIDVPALLDGLPITRETLSVGHPQVDWDVFVELMARLEREAGGSEALQRLGERITETKPAPILRRLAGLSASPLRLLRAGERWALRRAIPLLRSDIRRLGDGRVRIETVIPAPHRPCPALLHVAVGALRAAPRILDLPDALVSAEVQPSRARYHVVLPSSGTLGARLRRATRALFSARAAFDQLEVQQGELQQRFVELRAAYAVLEESEARHRALAETSVDIVAEVSSDGIFQYVSPSVEEHLGYRPDELLGTRFADWVHPEDLNELQGEFERVIQGGVARRPIVRGKDQRGDWRWLEIEGRNYRGLDGEPRAVCIVRDVSERIEREAERRHRQEELEAEVERRTRQLERRNRELRELQSLLLEAERLGAGEDLAGRIAHAIHAPLGALIGHVQLALRESTRMDSGADASSEARLERVLSLACRVRDVVTRTLDLYREGKLDRRSESPLAMLEELAAELEGRAALCGVEIECQAQEVVGDIEVDRTLIAGALLAVAENALEALQGQPEGRLQLTLAKASAGDAVEFRILDNGPGVPEALRASVFDPFFTTKASGTGLGLAVARGVVQGHGGEILLEEAPGGGSQVRIRLPRTAL